MHVHARAVVAEDWLRHEGDSLARRPAGVLDDVFELHHVIGGSQHGVELVVDLGLASGAHLVVCTLYLKADILQVFDHGVAQVAEVVRRSYWEVAALVLHFVGAVAALFFTTGVPGASLGIDVVERSVLLGLEASRIEDVKLGFGSEERLGGDASGSQVVLGLARNVARVAAVGLLGQRIVHEEADHQGLRLAERIDERGGRIRQQRHVRFVDLLEPTDRGAVEGQAIFENLWTKRPSRDGEMLHNTRQVAEPDVDHFDTLVLDVGQQVVGALEHVSSKVSGMIRIKRYGPAVTGRLRPCFSRVTRLAPDELSR